MPSVTLALCVFLNSSIYNVSGLELYNPIRNGSRAYDRWTEIGYVKGYCWANINHLDNETQEIIPLWHYPYFPYIMFTITALIYSCQLAWRLIELKKLKHG